MGIRRILDTGDSLVEELPPHSAFKEQVSSVVVDAVALSLPLQMSCHSLEILSIRVELSVIVTCFDVGCGGL